MPHLYSSLLLASLSVALRVAISLLLAPAAMTTSGGTPRNTGLLSLMSLSTTTRLTGTDVLPLGSSSFPDFKRYGHKRIFTYLKTNMSILSKGLGTTLWTIKTYVIIKDALVPNLAKVMSPRLPWRIFETLAFPLLEGLCPGPAD